MHYSLKKRGGRRGNSDASGACFMGAVSKAVRTSRSEATGLAQVPTEDFISFDLPHVLTKEAHLH